MSLDLNLEYFIESYIDITSELLKKETLLKFYDKSIRKTLSNKFNLSEQDFTHIHHSFHWTFFRDKNGSPFEFSPKSNADELRVRPIREVSPEEKFELKDYILNKYGKYLVGRFGEIGINIPSQLSP